MSRNNSLTDLKNIGKKITRRLNKEKYPDETLPVCYYLYSFEGALNNKHWDEIGEQRKQQLKAQIG